MQVEFTDDGAVRSFVDSLFRRVHEHDPHLRRMIQDVVERGWACKIERPPFYRVLEAEEWRQGHVSVRGEPWWAPQEGEVVVFRQSKRPHLPICEPCGIYLDTLVVEGVRVVPVCIALDSGMVEDGYVTCGKCGGGSKVDPRLAHFRFALHTDTDGVAHQWASLSEMLPYGEKA